MKSEPQDWPRAVIFDLDGTLIDSAPDIAYALNRATERQGLEPFPLDQVKEMIGGGVPKLVERALRARGVSTDGLAHIVSDFIGFYRENLTTGTTVYPGALELLDQLRSEGRALGLCTNKQHELTLAILAQLDLAQYFGSVVGERSGRPRKPDPAPLLEVATALGVPPDGSVMIGDSEADVACARAAGIPAVVVTFGYARVAPEALGADAVISHFGELRRRLAALRPEARGS